MHRHQRIYQGRWGDYIEPHPWTTAKPMLAIKRRKRLFMAELDKTEQRVIDLRRAGWTFKRIADELGYSNASGPANVFKRIMDEQYQVTRAAADAFRQEEAERLDEQLQLLISGQTAAPENLAYVDKILKVLERKARLMGLDAPTRVESTVNMNLSHEDALELLDQSVADTAEDDDTPQDSKEQE